MRPAMRQPSAISRIGSAHRARRWTLLLVLLAFVLPANGQEAPDVVLVVLDDLRAEAADSGFLGELALQGARFDRARSAAATTRASHASLLTGTHAGVHGMLGEPGEQGTALQAELPVLPELLAAAGYRTLGRSSAPGGLEALGLRGFADYAAAEDPAALGAELAASLDGDQPTFAWLHAAALRPVEESAAVLHARSMDSWLRAVLEPVLRTQASRPRALLITSDHGLHLGEHGLTPATPSLFEPALAVPLVMLLPNAERVRVPRTVSGVDVAPTLLELAGIQAPDHLQGSSFLDDARGELGHWGLVWSEIGTLENELVCMSWGPDKLLANRITKSDAVLHDLSADPGEMVNGKATHPEKAVFLAEHMQALEAWNEELRSRFGG